MKLSVTERMWRVGRAINSSYPWLPPILMSISILMWILSLAFRVQTPFLRGRVLASGFVVLYLIGALIELRILLLARLSWNLMKDGRSIGLRDVAISAFSIALYPIVIGALLMLRILRNGRVSKRDSLLTIVTLGFWLSVAQTRILSNISKTLFTYQVSEPVSSGGK